MRTSRLSFEKGVIVTGIGIARPALHSEDDSQWSQEGNQRVLAVGEKIEPEGASYC
jgi:hypothetical protein